MLIVLLKKLYSFFVKHSKYLWYKFDSFSVDVDRNRMIIRKGSLYCRYKVDPESFLVTRYESMWTTLEHDEKCDDTFVYELYARLFNVVRIPKELYTEVHGLSARPFMFRYELYLINHLVWSYNASECLCQKLDNVQNKIHVFKRNTIFPSHISEKIVSLLY